MSPRSCSAFAFEPLEPLQLINVEDIIIENGRLDLFMVHGLAGSGLSRSAPVLIGLGAQTFEASITPTAAIPVPASLWTLLAAVGGSACAGAGGIAA